MTLPVIQLPWTKHTFKSGDIIEIRGLSRAEALVIGLLGPDPLAIETHAIAFATDTTLEDAEKWVRSTQSGEVRDLFEVIKELSGLGGKEGKDDAED